MDDCPRVDMSSRECALMEKTGAHQRGRYAGECLGVPTVVDRIIQQAVAQEYIYKGKHCFLL